MAKLKYLNIFEQYESNFDTDFNFLSIPDALLARNRDSLFSTWQILETQLLQMDPVKNPDVYQALDERAATVFSAWMCFRDFGKEMV